MIRSGGRIFISFIILIIFSISAMAGGVGTTGANYLKIDPGARSSALGSAYVGLADDLNTLYFNPAGIARIPYAAIDTMQLNWLADISQQQIAGIYPLGGWGVIGGYYSNLSTPHDAVTQYDAVGNFVRTGDSFNNEIKLVNITYAKKLSSKLSLGIGLKQIEERLADVKKTGMAMDAGLHYKGLFFRDLSVGLVMQNYSLKPLRAEEPLPQTVILGFAYDFQLFGSQHLILLADVSFPIDNEKFYGVGAEYSINKYLSFRIGYKDNVGATLGGGLHFGNLNLNYAYVPYGELGNAYRISVGYDFDNSSDIFEKAEEKEKVEQVPATDEELFEDNKTSEDKVEQQEKELPEISSDEGLFEEKTSAEDKEEKQEEELPEISSDDDLFEDAEETEVIDEKEELTDKTKISDNKLAQAELDELFDN